MQMINFMKNLAMTGGLLMFVRYGAGQPSIDEKIADSPVAYRKT
jgi:putative oxidoreductase